jgi:hypothetical protein
MKRQRGVSISGLLVVVTVLIMVALLGMKVAPSVIEYLQIKKAIKSVAADASLKNASVADVRKAFGKYQEIDNFKKVSPPDIDVTKEGGDLVLGFSYQDKIPLFANVSLLFEYEATSTQ